MFSAYSCEDDCHWSLPGKWNAVYSKTVNLFIRKLTPAKGIYIHILNNLNQLYQHQVFFFSKELKSKTGNIHVSFNMMCQTS